MKVLIWIGCFFVATILNTILGYATGVKVGYLIFYFAVYFVAKKLCNKWDEQKGDPAAPDEVPKPTTQRISICANCGYQALDFDQCPQCGKTLKLYEYKDIDAQSPQEDQSENSCFCQNCGEKLLDGSQFCRKCGTEIIG